MAWVPFAAMAASMLADKFLNKNKMDKVSTQSKAQRQMNQQMMQMLSPNGNLGQGYQQGLDLQRQYMDPSSDAVQQFAQPYINEFNQKTIPGLAERFAGMGAMGGGLSSSGFGQSIGAAGANLQAQLAQLKAGLGQQAAQSLMNQYGNMSQMAMNAQPFAYQQQGPSMTGGMLQGWAQGGFPGASNMSDSLANMYQKYMPFISAGGI